MKRMTDFPVGQNECGAAACIGIAFPQPIANWHLERMSPGERRNLVLANAAGISSRIRCESKNDARHSCDRILDCERSGKSNCHFVLSHGGFEKSGDERVRENPEPSFDFAIS